METFGKAVLVIVATIISVLIAAWAFQTLWIWFIVPLGVSSISMAHAYGIMLVFSILKIRPKDFETEDKKDVKPFSKYVERLCVYSLVYLVAVGMGWITMLFM